MPWMFRFLFIATISGFVAIMRLPDGVDDPVGGAFFGVFILSFAGFWVCAWANVGKAFDGIRCGDMPSRPSDWGTEERKKEWWEE